MTVTNLSDKLVDKLYEDSKTTMLEFYQYLGNDAPEYRKSLEIEPKLNFTFDVSVITSRLIFCVAYFMSYKAYSNNEIPLERLVEFTERLEEIPSDYSSDSPELSKFKDLTDNIYNSAIKHRGVICKK